MESGVTTGWAGCPRAGRPGAASPGAPRVSGAPRMITRGSGQELHLPRQAGAARTGEIGAPVDCRVEGGHDAEDAREVRGGRGVVGHDGTGRRAGLVDGARGTDGEGPRGALLALREASRRADVRAVGVRGAGDRRVREP